MVVFVLTATIVGVVGVSPALATWTPGAPSNPGNVAPTVVADGRCSKVGSAGEHQLKIAKLYQMGTKVYSGPGGATITITSDGKTFSWQISSGFVVNDVTALGSLTPFNHYDYGTPRGEDGNLHAPLLANKLRTLGWGYFCYSPVEVEVETITLSGTKFHDENIDGHWDNELEDGLSGWTITAAPTEGEGSVSSVTGSDGSWELEVAPGSYTICESAPPEQTFGQSFPDNTNCPGQYSGGHNGNFVEDTPGLNFGNYLVTVLGCGDSVNLVNGNTTATFTRDSEGCEGTKPHATEITDLDEVIFVPGDQVGGAPSSYTGTITFVKPLQNPIPALLYDQTVFNGEDDFTEVPPCQGGSPPEPEVDTWCVAAVDVESIDGQITIEWTVLGTGDPRFK